MVLWVLFMERYITILIKVYSKMHSRDDGSRSKYVMTLEVETEASKVHWSELHLTTNTKVELMQANNEVF